MCSYAFAWHAWCFWLDLPWWELFWHVLQPQECCSIVACLNGSPDGATPPGHKQLGEACLGGIPFFLSLLSCHESFFFYLYSCPWFKLHNLKIKTHGADICLKEEVSQSVSQGLFIVSIMHELEIAWVTVNYTCCPWEATTFIRMSGVMWLSGFDFWALMSHWSDGCGETLNHLITWNSLSRQWPVSDNHQL